MSTPSLLTAKLARSPDTQEVPDWNFRALVVFLVALFFIPSTFVIAGLGSFATPADIMGLVCLVMWLNCVRQRHIQAMSFVARIFVALLCLVTLLSAWASTQRAMDGLESRAIIRWFAIVAALSGVVLLAAEGTRNKHNLDRLLTLIATFASVMAVIAIIQFFYAWNLAPLFRHIPGLKENAPYDSYISRANFRRVQATAQHPIEFGFVLAMALPISIVRAVRGLPNRWLPVLQALAIVLAMAISLSRSAVLELAIVVLSMLPILPRLARRLIVVAGIVFLVVLRFAEARLVSVLVNLFTGAGSDTSITHRTNDYETAAKYFGEHPWFGRGLGTFLPQVYVTLDNQYILSILEMGAIGLLAILLIFIFGVRYSYLAGALALDADSRLLARALASSFLAAAAGFAFFDGMSFPMGRGLLFVMVGLVCANFRYAQAGDLRVEHPVLGSGGPPDSWPSTPGSPEIPRSYAFSGLDSLPTNNTAQGSAIP